MFFYEIKKAGFKVEKEAKRLPHKLIMDIELIY
jgi:hypothetical protein